ncbi:hypothetical protein I6F35_37635 [Bradyrhizobium sp. BRP22]|uniref:hypothetical protein n=1 Tax=Bradyrhizobium sp. BRP22 TaxID=2793821 RepID=UPI001CD6AA50|nr:hypothetical protein [Bradyrhizobium sp. BRP22]MCA1458815.1 hypothetical protein [Bradyrhizobium sp. BRP22]
MVLGRDAQPQVQGDFRRTPSLGLGRKKGTSACAAWSPELADRDFKANHRPTGISGEKLSFKSVVAGELEVWTRPIWQLWGVGGLWRVDFQQDSARLLENHHLPGRVAPSPDCGAMVSRGPNNGDCFRLYIEKVLLLALRLRAADFHRYSALELGHQDTQVIRKPCEQFSLFQVSCQIADQFALGRISAELLQLLLQVVHRYARGAAIQTN